MTENCNFQHSICGDLPANRHQHTQTYRDTDRQFPTALPLYSVLQAATTITTETHHYCNWL